MVEWKVGDVLLLDVLARLCLLLINSPQNRAVQHAREPWKGNRKLLASLWDE